MPDFRQGLILKPNMATRSVVCPVALVKQWAQEIKKYAGGNLRVEEHHGPSRTSGRLYIFLNRQPPSQSRFLRTDPEVLARAHVVVCYDLQIKVMLLTSYLQVTSYNIVASEYASWSGDGEGKWSKTKTKPKETVVSEPDSDSSSNFGKTLKQARTNKAPAKKKGKQIDALFRVQWWRIVLGESQARDAEHSGDPRRQTRHTISKIARRNKRKPAVNSRENIGGH